MSWSRSVSGSPAEVNEQMAGVAASVESTDRSYNASEAIVAGHQKQIERVQASVAAFVEQVPEGFAISGSVGGHSDGANSDSWFSNLSAYKPTIVS